MSGPIAQLSQARKFKYIKHICSYDIYQIYEYRHA